MQRGTYVESGHFAELLGMRVVGAASSRPQILWSGNEVNVMACPREIEEEEEEALNTERLGPPDTWLEFFVLRSAFAWPHKISFCQITRMYLCAGKVVRVLRRSAW
ncbi:hypothetical protein TraAM80_08163 [Trypanosoma rangeli]|uniref:Retrotransposon hot spot protein N-terminal domain-containing protein n=1 Tax=Trypanosoma rangeli TaxID=5698 RepID=A0A422N1Y6_TRYRA|nr:uncharacterized protein TraAM80_08163 [Trypanosoma rangeli]RNE99471.1 hypothetical protein TraAM80_08163 [Trypanosoma rangeli]|eukprot:RNE99471.1 hypothetical protein TraAM80_08163 [Trypanosoma rangeli]